VQETKDDAPADEMELPGHERHDKEPLMSEYLPAAHAMQSDGASLPTVSRYEPGGQLRHVVLDDEPLMSEYLPAAHAMQSDSASLPIVSRYEPGGQLKHAVLDDEPLTTEYLPAAQSVQSPLPAADLYFPATHAVHVPVTAGVPTLQDATKPELTWTLSEVNTT
jgi:hypothetical protein